MVLRRGVVWRVAWRGLRGLGAVDPRGSSIERLVATGCGPACAALIPSRAVPLQGYFLLRESMLDSVLLARDKFLAPGGALYPSHARMFLAPIRSGMCHQRQAEFQVRRRGWAGPGRRG